MAVELCVADVSTNIMLAKFANGNLINSSSLKDIKLYKNTNPRSNPKHKILVTETSRLAYKGANFGQDSRAHLASLCKTNDEEEKANEDTSTEEQQEDLATQRKKKFILQHENLTMAFGTRAKQKVIESKQKLKVNSGDLFVKMQDTINKIEVKEPQPMVDPIAALADILPPINRNAEIEADICNIKDLVSMEDLVVFENMAKVLSDGTDDNIETWKRQSKYPAFVLESLTYLKKDEMARLQKCKLLLYYSCLVALLQVKYVHLKNINKGLLTEVIPEPLRSKLLKKYFKPANTATGNWKVMSPKDKDKVSSYAIAMALLLDEFVTDANNLKRDLKIADSKFRAIVAALGAKERKVTGVVAKNKTRAETIVWEVPLKTVSQQLLNKATSSRRKK